MRKPTEMELRVAKAAYFAVQSGDERTWEEVMAQEYNRPRDLCIAAAPAAIRAMREPTQGMLEAADDGTIDHVHFSGRWGAAIDAASPPE